MIWDQCVTRPDEIFKCDLQELQESLCLCKIDGNFLGLSIEIVLFFLSFAALALSADHICNSMETLCTLLKVPDDIGGATFMALGGAIPEIVLTVLMTVKSLLIKKSTGNKNIPKISDGYSETEFNELLIYWHENEGYDNKGYEIVSDSLLGAGALTGSGLIGILLLPALCALVSPGKLLLKKIPLLRDVTVYTIAVSLFLVGIYNGVSLIICIMLLLNYFFYILFLIYQSKSEIQSKNLSIANSEKKTLKSTSNISQNELKNQEKRDSICHYRSRSYIHFTKSRTMKLSSLCLPPPDLQDHDEEFNFSCENPLTEKTFISDKDTHSFFLTPKDQLYATLSLKEKVVKSIKSISLIIAWPIDKTCPDCSMNSRRKKLWPITLLISIIWLLFFSSVLSAIICRWIKMMNIEYAKPFFGLSVISFSSQIPDTVNALAVAKRGYGSMAASACFGSQIIGLCVGIGGTWLLTVVAANKHDLLNVSKNKFMKLASPFLLFVALGFGISTLGVSTLTTRKYNIVASISKRKAFCMIASYFLILVFLAALNFSNELIAPCPYHTFGNPKYVRDIAGWKACYEAGECSSVPP